VSFRDVGPALTGAIAPGRARWSGRDQSTAWVPTRGLIAGGLGLAAAVVAGFSLRLDPWTAFSLLPLVVLVPLLLALHWEARRDRDRMRGLFGLALEANRRLSQDAVSDAVLAATRGLLRCERAELRTAAPNPAAGDLVVALPHGPGSRWLVAGDRPRGRPFDRTDGIVAEAVAAIAGAALTNADLYQQIRLERGRLAAVTLNLGEGVCAVDTDGNLTFANPAAAALIRLPGRRVPVGDQLPPEVLRAPEFLLVPARAVLRGGGVVHEDEAYFERPDGQSVQVAYTASAMRHNGRVIGAVISFRDITERRRLEAILAHQARFDSLTGLVNRRLIVERLEAALARSEADGHTHAVIFVDVDRFKAINDSLGHGTGDRLLVAVGARMRQVVGGRGTVGRLGGDEFVILLEDVGGREEAEAVARRLCAAVEEPLVLKDGYEIVAGISAGVALTEAGQTADDVLHNADVAMYRAKGRGGTYQVFDRRLMGARSAERILLEAALRKGIERGELEVHYQPLVTVDGGEVVGAEALIRWRRPNQGLVGPERFIPLAEETGLILPIGRFVLEEACRQVCRVRAATGRDLPIAVNLSPRQFQKSSLLVEVAAALEQSGLEPHLLKFEITETMVMDDLAGATEIMNQLNRLGVRLAIDDFGTGHSSLGYLKHFPVHEVKVDRLFVQNLPDDPVDRAIVGAVVDLARAMGIDAVAEGVELPTQLDELRRLGCHLAQGYLFSPPVPGEDLIARLMRVPAAPVPDRRAG
jgi:diguanylate cyclase (GGDEF)-like protein/PAS domain S-box-containing protein